MDPCHDLDDDTHRVFQTACEKRNANQGWSKKMPDTIADVLGVERKKVRALLEDLANEGLVEVKENGVIMLLKVCGCQPSHTERIASATTRRRGRPRGDFNSPSPFRLPPEARETTEVGRDHHRMDDDESTQGVSKASRRVKVPPRKEPHDMNALDLAYYFNEQMNLTRSAGNFGTIGATNTMAMARQFRHWIREDGIAPAGIYYMIDVFVLDSRWLRQGVPAWRSFLSNRAVLAERASTLMEAHANADLGWVESADLDPVEDDDEDEGLGWS